MKVAVVTGGSSGIGLAIAKKYALLDYKVYSLDLNAPETSESNIEFIKTDISSEESIDSAFQEILKDNQSVSVLVNNCGFQHMAPVEDFSVTIWKKMIDVMLTGTFICTQKVVPGMKKQGFGRIINISSVHGKVASPFKSAYVSAKHGVLGFTKTVAKELAGDGVTVNSICPGFVDTPLMRAQIEKQMQLNNLSEDEVLEKIFLKEQSIKKLTSPDQVASMCEYLTSELASTITGEAYNISGGWAN